MAAEAKEDVTVDKDGGDDLTYDKSDEPPVRRIAVVTGANKGIGFECVRQLAAANADMLVYLTARDAGRGRQALQRLRREGLGRVVFWPLDITDAATVEGLRKHLEETWGRLDILLHNAGFAYKGDTWGADEARRTIEVNYHGAMTVCDGLLPLLRKSPDDAGRIVTVCSTAGRLRQLRPELQARFTREGLVRSDITELMETFIEAVRTDTYRAQGWSKSMYGISKLGEIAYTKVLAEELRESNMHVNACCPGWCATDMSSHTGERTAAKGAETPVWLCTRGDDEIHGSRRGLFYSDKAEIAW